MPKRRFEILLPLTHNDGRPVAADKFLQTREELVAEFGALSFYPQPIRGLWTHKGARHEEDSLRIFVDVSDTSKNRRFFAKWKARLLQRFEQIEIYIASYPVDIL